MDITVQEAMEPEIGGCEVVEGKNVRRRLIQSTLFPHKESPVKEGENCHDDEDQDYEGEEYCGSQSKKKRKTKPKAVPRPRASKKVAINGKETPSRKVDNKASPVIVKSGFFLNASEKRNQKSQLKEQLCVSLPEESSNPPSPPDNTTNKSPGLIKKRTNSTPRKRCSARKKIVMSGGLKESCSQHSGDPTESEHTSLLIPNLRLEAKLKAEENSRIYGGRQTHPFFSSMKMSKRNLETTIEEGKWCSAEKTYDNITCKPVHVFEVVQDDAVCLDWGNWEFSEGNLFNVNSGPESLCSFRNSAKSLEFDNFLSDINATSTLLQNDVLVDQFLTQEQKVFNLDQLPSQLKHWHEISPTLLDLEQVTNHVTLEPQHRSLGERVMSYCHGCHHYPRNSLWTNKYKPKKAIEVCGNNASVKFLSEWLHLWHQRGLQANKDSISNDKQFLQDGDWHCSGSDCESDTISDSLKNVLLVTGPFGSGKSAAIYACAKEQGFQVIEVNASDWRNGALVKQRFGEAVESHWRQRSLENPMCSESKHLLKSSPAKFNNSGTQGSDTELIEQISLSDEEDSQDAKGIIAKFDSKNNKTANYQNGMKTVILFEDVDATIGTDHGLIATVQKLAEIAKKPIIVTCNSSNPILPNNLDRLEVCFTKPSHKELLQHVHMVCAAEKVNIQPFLLERFINYCQEDIRKTIMHLQFWCQGRPYSKDGEVQKAYGSLLFDLDACHQILPRIIPWGYPSELSELVEREITKSVLTTEENTGLMVVTEEEVNHTEIYNKKTVNIAAKKEAILSGHCFMEDGSEFAAHFDTTSEVACSSGSPVAFTRRNIRKKHDMVLSSSSVDEDNINDTVPEVSKAPVDIRNKKILFDLNEKPPSPCPADNTCFSPLSEQLLHSEAAGDSLINSKCISVDLSRVPESSFVPETEINNGMVLYSGAMYDDHIAGVVESVSKRTDTMQNLLPSEVENLTKSTTRSVTNSEIMGNFALQMGSIHEEEVGDSQSQCVEGVSKGYQVMDECSRMNFSRRRSKSIKEPGSSLVTGSVEETWKKLRICCSDLRKHVDAEMREGYQALKLSSRMCNLMQNADLLLGDCQSLIYDSLEPKMVPCDEEKSFRWHDDQLQMASTIMQHGICVYAKDVTVLGSKMGSSSKIDLAGDMLASSNCSTALGKLVNQDQRVVKNLELGPPSKNGIFSDSEFRTGLHSIVESIVPTKSYLAVKGNFHEYLSTLGQISRSEASRLAEGVPQTTKRRRPRVARHYLSGGPLGLSPEDISLLGQYNSCYHSST